MFTWRSGDGTRYELIPPEYIVRSHEGLGMVPVELQTQRSPYQHGTTLIDSRLNERDFSLTIMIPGRTKQEKFEKRRELVTAFSPRLGMGRLIWRPGNLEKEFYIDAIADEAPVMPTESGGPLHQEAIVNLMAPDPTFYEPEPEKIDHDTSAESRVKLQNAGDVETPVKIYVPGPCEDPTLLNRNTGEAIYIDGLEIGEDETLEIDTAYGKKYARLRTDAGAVTNVLNRVEVGSQLFYLKPGTNRIDWRAKSGEPTIKYEYHNRYAGV